MFWTFKDVIDAISPPAKGSFVSIQSDIVAASVAATDAIITYAKKKGYKMVRLDECIQAISQANETLSTDPSKYPESTNIHGGDTQKKQESHGTLILASNLMIGLVLLINVINYYLFRS